MFDAFCKVYGGTPPVPMKDCEYGEPTWASGSGPALLMANGLYAPLMDKLLVTLDSK